MKTDDRYMPFEKSQSEGAYFKLFFLVLAAVTLGNLLSTWITARVMTYRLEIAAAELAHEARASEQEARQAIETQRRQSERAAQEAQARLRDARRSDPTGRRLSQACAEWTRADTEMSSYTTRHERERACARLTQYVESGRWPQ